MEKVGKVESQTADSPANTRAKLSADKLSIIITIISANVSTKLAADKLSIVLAIVLAII